LLFLLLDLLFGNLHLVPRRHNDFGGLAGHGQCDRGNREQFAGVKLTRSNLGCESLRRNFDSKRTGSDVCEGEEAVFVRQRIDGRRWPPKNDPPGGASPGRAARVDNLAAQHCHLLIVGVLSNFLSLRETSTATSRQYPCEENK